MFGNKFITLELRRPHETTRSPRNQGDFFPFPIKWIFPSSMCTTMFQHILVNNLNYMRLHCYFSGIVMSYYLFSLPRCPKPGRVRHSASYCWAQSAMNKAYTTTLKTSCLGSSQAKDNASSSRAPSFPVPLWSGILRWTEILFIQKLAMSTAYKHATYPNIKTQLHLAIHWMFLHEQIHLAI